MNTVGRWLNKWGEASSQVSLGVSLAEFMDFFFFFLEGKSSSINQSYQSYTKLLIWDVLDTWVVYVTAGKEIGAL